MLDPMETIPMPRNSRTKREIPIVTRAIYEFCVLRAQGSESRAQRGASRGRGRDSPICLIGPKHRAKRRAVAEIRKSRLPGATFKIRKFPLSPPIEPNLTPKSYLKKKNVRFAQSRSRLRRSALVLSLSAPEASEGSLDAVS